MVIREQRGFNIRGTTKSGTSAKIDICESSYPKGGIGGLHCAFNISKLPSLPIKTLCSVDTRKTTYLKYLFRYTILTPEVYKMRLSEHVAESGIAGGRTCVSHQFLKSVLLFTATSSSLAGRESPNFQRAFVVQHTYQRLKCPRRAHPWYEGCNVYLPTEQGPRKEAVHHGLLRNLHKTDPGHS